MRVANSKFYYINLVWYILLFDRFHARTDHIYSYNIYIYIYYQPYIYLLNIFCFAEYIFIKCYAVLYTDISYLLLAFHIYYIKSNTVAIYIVRK